MEFHETEIGKNYYGRQLPRVIKSLERIANVLERQEKSVPKKEVGSGALNSMNYFALRLFAKDVSPETNIECFKEEIYDFFQVVEEEIKKGMPFDDLLELFAMEIAEGEYNLDAFIGYLSTNGLPLVANLYEQAKERG